VNHTKEATKNRNGQPKAKLRPELAEAQPEARLKTYRGWRPDEQVSRRQMGEARFSHESLPETINP